MKINVHTPVWGAMIQDYIDVCMVCLVNNFRKCASQIDTYTLYASEEAKRVISATPRYDELASLVRVEWLPLQKPEGEVTSNVLEEMRRIAPKGNYMLQLTATGSIGDNSILNISKLADGTKNPILYADLKISPAGFQAIKDWIRERGGISNRELVSIGMKHLLGAKYSVQPCGPQEWRATFNVFSLIIIPDQKIIDFWATNPLPGSGYDHVMPYWMVTEGYPFYVIDDSDIYVTVDGEIGPPTMKFGEGTWHPGLCQDGEEYFGKYSVILRGEKEMTKNDRT